MRLCVVLAVKCPVQPERSRICAYFWPQMICACVLPL